jgi:hypothetical protein
MNVKIIGERKYYARISYTGNEDLIGILRENDFLFTLESKEFLDGNVRTIVEGSLENRARKELLKTFLKGRENKLVTIIPAREVYWV